MPQTSVFGEYAKKLRDNISRYLVALPNVLGVHQPPTESSPLHDGRQVLLQIYSRVPFEMFKTAVESPTFQIGKRRSGCPIFTSAWFLYYGPLTNFRYL
jgi:hypothetical protein